MNELQYNPITKMRGNNMNKLIQQISKQQKYHSFLLAKTVDKQLAEKWDYYILSAGGELLMNNDQLNNNQKQDQCEYNISVDTVSYQLSFGPTVKVILAQGNWLKACLLPTQLQLLNKVKIMKFQSLSISKSICFYYYATKSNLNLQTIQSDQKNKNSIIISQIVDQFVQVQPQYIFSNDCLLFQLSSHHTQASSRISYLRLLSQHLYFKNISNNYKLYSIPHIKNQEHDMSSFKSQYALLSDQHFLNCLVKRKKNIGSYFAVPGGYRFWIDENMFDSLSKLYYSPKL